MAAHAAGVIPAEDQFATGGVALALHVVDDPRQLRRGGRLRLGVESSGLAQPRRESRVVPTRRVHVAQAELGDVAGELLPLQRRRQGFAPALALEEGVEDVGGVGVAGGGSEKLRGAGGGALDVDGRHSRDRRRAYVERLSGNVQRL